MYPYPVFFGMTLYELMIAVGFFFAVLTLRIHADRRGYPAAFQNLAIVSGIGGIGIGYYAAVLVQAVYNYLDSGVWALNQSTGATFLGGLLGGVAVFFALYFGLGAIVFRGKDNPTRRLLVPLCNIAIAGVVIAHAFGRVGCLFAGCCHGAVAYGFPGIYNHAVGAYTIPIPLYEAIFLLALYAVMTVGLLKNKGDLLVLYLSSYGVWRFIIEFFRTDDRGQTIVPFLSPSQLTSLFMLLLAVVLWLVSRRKTIGKSSKKSQISIADKGKNGENPVENGDNSPISPAPEEDA